MGGLRQFKLMTRLSISAVIALAVMLVIMWESIWSIHDLVYDDRKIKTRQLVEARTPLPGRSSAARSATAQPPSPHVLPMP